MILQHIDGCALVRLEIPVVQCDHKLLARQSLQCGAMLLRGLPGDGLPPVREDPGIGLIPTGHPEVPEVNGQDHPLNAAKTLPSSSSSS